MKKKQQMQELRALDMAGLKAKSRQLAEELMKLRFRAASRQLQQSHGARAARRGLAQALTALGERKRGKAEAQAK